MGRYQSTLSPMGLCCAAPVCHTQQVAAACSSLSRQHATPSRQHPDTALCDCCLASPHAVAQLPHSSNCSGVSLEEIAVPGVGLPVSLIRVCIHVQRPGSSIVALLPVARPPVPASWGEACSCSSST